MTTILTSQQNVQNKINYKRQLKAEMMKTFGRFFTSGTDKTNQIGSALKTPGLFSSCTEEPLSPQPVYNLKLRMEHLAKQIRGYKDGYDIEFESLSKIDSIIKRQTGIFKSGNNSKNSHLNRFKRVLPNEKTRVKLIPKDPKQTDYINANYIPGNIFNVKSSYIVTQAPIPETFGDFWRMIYDYNCRIIVMLTEHEDEMMEEDNIFSKCTAHKYWPNLGETKLYDAYSVTTISQRIVHDVIFQEFLISYHGSTRKVSFMQYVGWPDMGVPNDSKSIMRMINCVNDIMKQSNYEIGPIVIHCSAGIGRTGTFATIHIFIQLLRDYVKQNPNLENPEFNFNIYDIVKKLKHYRVGMIQRKEQYVFCYSTILEEAERLGFKFPMFENTVV
jgi:protein tyrosine phosphatase